MAVDGVWLGHRRLSIVDVGGGHQPLRNAAGDAFLIGNGEVYNHAALRERLESDTWLTRSDNEVALHLIDRDGPEALKALNGMFAFVFAGADGRFVAARDPVGIKPLYWTPPPTPDRRPPEHDGDPVRFASEMHAFEAEWQTRVEPFPPGCAWTPQDGLERTVESLHNLNLQRADRVTMAHSLEARVPFLDREVIDWALRLEPEVKVPGPGEMEKQILREAFAGWLPDELLWRVKAEFGDGSGARDVLSDELAATVTDAAFAAERGAVEPQLRTKEEVAYYRVWRAHLEQVSPERTLSRFATA